VKESGQFKELVNLPPEKDAAVPIGQEACWALENMTFSEEGYSRPCWKSNPWRPTRNLVTIPTEHQGW